MSFDYNSYLKDISKPHVQQVKQAKQNSMPNQSFNPPLDSIQKMYRFVNQKKNSKFASQPEFLNNNIEIKHNSVHHQNERSQSPYYLASKTRLNSRSKSRERSQSHSYINSELVSTNFETNPSQKYINNQGKVSRPNQSIDLNPSTYLKENSYSVSTLMTDEDVPERIEPYYQKQLLNKENNDPYKRNPYNHSRSLAENYYEAGYSEPEEVIDYRPSIGSQNKNKYTESPEFNFESPAPSNRFMGPYGLADPKIQPFFHNRASTEDQNLRKQIEIYENILQDQIPTSKDSRSSHEKLNAHYKSSSVGQEPDYFKHPKINNFTSSLEDNSSKSILTSISSDYHHKIGRRDRDSLESIQFKYQVKDLPEIKEGHEAESATPSVRTVSDNKNPSAEKKSASKIKSRIIPTDERSKSPIGYAQILQKYHQDIPSKPPSSITKSPKIIHQRNSPISQKPKEIMTPLSEFIINAKYSDLKSVEGKPTDAKPIDHKKIEFNANSNNLYLEIDKEKRKGSPFNREEKVNLISNDIQKIKNFASKKKSAEANNSQSIQLAPHQLFTNFTEFTKIHMNKSPLIKEKSKPRFLNPNKANNSHSTTPERSKILSPNNKEKEQNYRVKENSPIKNVKEISPVRIRDQNLYQSRDLPVQMKKVSPERKVPILQLKNIKSSPSVKSKSPVRTQPNIPKERSKSPVKNIDNHIEKITKSKGLLNHQTQSSEKKGKNTGRFKTDGQQEKDDIEKLVPSVVIPNPSFGMETFSKQDNFWSITNKTEDLVKTGEILDSILTISESMKIQNSKSETISDIETSFVRNSNIPMKLTNESNFSELQNIKKTISQMEMSSQQAESEMNSLKRSISDTQDLITHPLPKIEKNLPIKSSIETILKQEAVKKSLSMKDGSKILAAASKVTPRNNYQLRLSYLQTFEGQKNTITSIIKNTTSNQLWSSSKDGSIWEWFDEANYSNESSISEIGRQVFKSKSSVETLILLCQGRIVIGSGQDHNIRLWNSKDFSLINSWKIQKSGIFDLKEYDEKTFLSASGDGKIHRWDLNAGSYCDNLSEHQNRVLSLAICRELPSEVIVSASTDRTIKLWDLRIPNSIETFIGHEREVTSVAFLGDMHNLASGSLDGSIKIWDLKKRINLNTVELGSEVSSLIYHTKSDKLLVGAEDLRVVKLDINFFVETFRDVQNSHEGCIKSLLIDNESDILYTGSFDKTLKSWNLKRRNF